MSESPSEGLLRWYFDSEERSIRDELVRLGDPHTAYQHGRVAALTAALATLDQARDALRSHPEDGPELAWLVLGIALQHHQIGSMQAERYYRGALKGRDTVKAKAVREPPHYRTIRALARKLHPDLTIAAKARLIQQKFPDLSTGHLERILRTEPPKKKSDKG